MPKPVLTFGMIVKNEVRCLERCLKALQPLRDALPCELIIADTGSDDGTREIAEKYADLVFDFPWINDFSAARNSVLDRASGEWFISVDADEYLDEDCTELVEHLKHPESLQYDICGVIIRNYASMELKGPYSDFIAIRMIRMSTGMRYYGAIHEAWTHGDRIQILGLRKTVFHHDGYVGFGTEAARKKQKRNMALLEKTLEANPNDLKTMLQCVESSVGTGKYLDYVRASVKGVEKKLDGWERLGPVILRNAVNAAVGHKLDELTEWVSKAEKLFPTSLYTNISINRAILLRAFGEKDYPEVIRRGEIYLRTARDYEAGNFNPMELCLSALDISSEYEDTVRIFLADAYFHENRYPEARDALAGIKNERLELGQFPNYIGALSNLHAQGGIDVEALFTDIWKQLNERSAQSEAGQACKRAVLEQTARAYTPEFRAEEDRNGFRHAYTLLLALKDEHELGFAAAILETEDPQEIRDYLLRVEKWEEFPISALVHALQCGVSFPLPEKTLQMEESDILASRLVKEQFDWMELLQSTSDAAGLKDLSWRKSLVMAAMRDCAWDAEGDIELAREFAKIERQFLRSCYLPEVLQAENLFILPPMHRFGWHSAQAFEALDSGDTAGYVRCLREGLTSCEGMKPMVEYLVEHTPELRPAEPSRELLVLAQKVRLMLLQFAPGTPAVEAIKNSEAYQKVAHLIEGVEVVPMGGLVQ